MTDVHALSVEELAARISGWFKFPVGAAEKAATVNAHAALTELVRRLDAVKERDEAVRVRNVYVKAAEAAEARVAELEAALSVYADPCHWGIQRDDFKHPSVVWIGPGATDTPVPDAPDVARRALAGPEDSCVCGEINTRHCPVHGSEDSPSALPTDPNTRAWLGIEPQFTDVEDS